MKKNRQIDIKSSVIDEKLRGAKMQLPYTQ